MIFTEVYAYGFEAVQAFLGFLRFAMWSGVG